MGDSRPGTCHLTVVTGPRPAVTFCCHLFSIGRANLSDPMYREKLVQGKFTSNLPVSPIRLVLKSLPPEFFTSNLGLSKIRLV